MFITELSTNRKFPIIVEIVSEPDYKSITKKQFYFNWRKEKDNQVYKLRIKNKPDILGVMSLKIHNDEKRIEISLLSVQKENVGSNKKLDGIGGNLIAYAARLAIKNYGAEAAISLIPKTQLSQHYIDKYRFENAGRSLFLEGINLIQLLKDYNYEQ